MQLFYPSNHGEMINTSNSFNMIFLVTIERNNLMLIGYSKYAIKWLTKMNLRQPVLGIFWICIRWASACFFLLLHQQCSKNAIDRLKLLEQDFDLPSDLNTDITKMASDNQKRRLARWFVWFLVLRRLAAELARNGWSQESLELRHKYPEARHAEISVLPMT